MTTFFDVSSYLGVDPLYLLSGEKKDDAIVDPEEQELIDIFRLLDEKERMLFMADARGRRELHEVGDFVTPLR